MFYIFDTRTGELYRGKGNVKGVTNVVSQHEIKHAENN